jgi:hypothetical protein
MMNLPEQHRPHAEEWARRKRNNIRLGWVFALVVLALFALSILKYRPL